MNKVLIIEDSRTFSELIVNTLSEQLGVDCDLAHSKQEALSLLNSGNQYQLAIVDLHLPDASDSEIIDDLAPFKITSIVFTGDLDKKLREMVIRNDWVADYVFKPSTNSLNYVCEKVSRILSNQQVEVLVVDSSKATIDEIHDMLSRQGLSVHRARNAEQAKTIYQYHANISLILIDYSLPDSDGFKLIQYFRKEYNHQELKIVGLIDTAIREEGVMFLKVGADDFVTKPIVMEELVCRVTHSLNNKDTVDILNSTNENLKMVMKLAAHDIRNPLSNIMTLTELLASPLKDSGFQDEAGMLVAQSMQLVNLVDGLSDYINITAENIVNKVHPYSTNMIIESQLGLLQETAKQKDIALDISWIDGVVPCDPVLISRVVANLIGNAIKYSPKSSRIKIVSKFANGLWVLSVEDEGPGIAPEEQGKLFKPFQKLGNIPTAGEYSSGIGLSICKRIVDAHKGKIDYQNTGKGSVFTLLLKSADE